MSPGRFSSFWYVEVVDPFEAAGATSLSGTRFGPTVRASAVTTPPTANAIGVRRLDKVALTFVSLMVRDGTSGAGAATSVESLAIGGFPGRAALGPRTG